MGQKTVKIGVVAPGRALTAEISDAVQTVAAQGGHDVSIRFHPQCFERHGHFAGEDARRGAAFVEFANDPQLDAIWFGRGGYGACRFDNEHFTALNDHARRKIYLGYSDAGFLLATLYSMDFSHLAHAPMPADILRPNGANAINRVLRFLTQKGAATDDCCVERQTNAAYAAFNITILAHLVGTKAMPDLRDHILLLEDVGEYHYRLDRCFYSILNTAFAAQLKGIALGRCSDIPQNDVTFHQDEDAIARYWCERAGVPYLGRADIGHDADNKIVPFGHWPRQA